MVSALPPAGSGHPTPCMPTLKHGGSQLQSARPLHGCPGCPSERETWVRAVPVARARTAVLAAPYCCFSPAPRPCRCRGHSLWSTILLFLVPATLSRRQAAMPCCVWGHYPGQPCCELRCGSFRWPDSPSLGKPHKCCTEMHVLVYFKVSPSLSKCFAEWNPVEHARLSLGLLGRREAIKHRRVGEAVCTYELISEVLAAMEKTRLLLFFLCKIIWGSLESAKCPDPAYAQCLLDIGASRWA